MKALDGARARAIELRLQRWSSTRIAAELGVAPSTEYLWTKHIPLDRTPEEEAERRHPSTVRKNVDDLYRGCLVVYVPKSDKLYRRIEGILEGVAAAVGTTSSG